MYHINVRESDMSFIVNFLALLLCYILYIVIGGYIFYDIECTAKRIMVLRGWEKFVPGFLLLLDSFALPCLGPA